MSEVILYSFKDSEQLAESLRTVVHFMGSAEWSGLVYTTITLAIAVGLLMARGVDPLAFGKALVLPILLYYVIISPTVDVNIVDEQSRKEIIW